MKICVLQPDYSTTDVDYKHYDPPRHLQLLCPNAIVDTIFLNKLTTYKQLKQLSKQGYDIFVNLCEGYLDWSVPSIDVIHAFDTLNLPHTGPTALLYDPSKPLMKYVAYSVGVRTPSSIVLTNINDINAVSTLSFPLFVKPAHAGDSLGIDDKSYVTNQAELKAKVTDLLTEYDDILVEQYIEGREFTVLVAANADGKTCRTFAPVEYVFPKDRFFKTYSLKVTESHTSGHIPCTDSFLSNELQSAAEKIFKGFEGVGYARLDFRVNSNNDVYFLEINFTCSVFYEEGYEGGADYILKYDVAGKSGFLNHIIEEGIARHQRKQKKYTLKGNGVSGYGVFAKENIFKDAVIFKGEAQPQRIVTKNYVKNNWNNKEKNDFKHYAFPISPDVYILWDENPINWSPQNHSCDPNTVYKGLDVVALKDIIKGEELTLDYASFYDDNIDAFTCHCGSINCRGVVSGTKGNRIT